ncbi:deleted in lung and esophageal cancer protein 1-like [Octopus sinensis]|uniref:Deleted in lung and esophageal cancer protein 1-like n=1 Tax=Octopus sinensis TaxID=2607531 RepID=A0A7E6FS75_9MOLL|nr:deleted in lung and esophageal cancer protein 1-like [Octopus sinensis]
MSELVQDSTMCNKTNKDPCCTGSENTMLLQRPAPVKCQDINHVLTSALRDILSQDKLCMTTVENLITSKGSKDPHHERYVEWLNQVCKEREKRLSQISMLERHLMQVQARVVSADERMLNTFKSFGGHETLDIPKGFSCYRSYVNSRLLKENGLIVPDDYLKDEMTEISKKLLKSPTKRFSRYKDRTALPQRVRNDPSYLQTTASWLHHNYEKSRVYSDALAKKLFSSSLDKLNLSTPDFSLPAARKSITIVEKPNIPRKRESNPLTNGLQCEKDFAEQMLAPVNFLVNPRNRKLSDKLKPRLLTEIPGNKSCPSSVASAEEQVKESPLFLPTPRKILFTDYRSGEIYEARLELKNVSSVLRPCRVIPPATKYFLVGLGQFPNEQGLVAPGMSCIYTIRFAPDTLGSFKDELQVVTQSSTNIIVPLLAKRPHPILTLPSVLDIGFCLIGCKLVTHVVIKNIGGSGCFCMMPADLWNTTAYKAYAQQENIGMPPFCVGPATFGMRKNLVGVIEVRFEPQMVGRYSCKLAIVCDNCEVKYFTIIGHCQKAKVMLAEHEGLCSRPLPNESYDSLAHHLIRFKDTNVYSYEQKTITIRNCTSIDFPFFWFPVKPDFQRGNDLKPNKIAEKNSAFRVFPNCGRLKANAKKQFQIMFAPEKVSLSCYVQLDAPVCIYIMSIDFPFFWFPVKPDFQRGNDLKPNKIAEKNSAFRVFPNCGRLKANAKKQFQIMFAPEKVGSFDCVWHMILEEPPSHKDFMSESVIFSDRRHSLQLLKNIEKELQKRMSSTLLGEAADLMIAMKGRCVPFAVLIQPYALFIHEPILIGSTEHRQIQVTNNSCNEISFHWQCEHSDLFIIKMEPTEGVVETGKTADCQLCLTGLKPGEINMHLKCYLEYQEEPICYHLQASFKGPKVVVENSSIDFGLVCLGDCVLKELCLQNKSPVPAEFHIAEIPEPDTPVGSQAHLCEIQILPNRGIISPLKTEPFNLTFFSKEQMVFNDVFVRCKVMEMRKFLCLAITADVKGLIIQYQVSKDGYFNDESPDDDEPVVLDFGEEVMVATKPCLYLRIKNVTEIESTYSVSAEKFPVDNSVFQPSMKAQRINAKLPKPFTSPSAKRTDNVGVRAEANPTQINGAGLLIEPLSGKLPALSYVIVKITLISSMWGNYRDNLLCKTGDLDVVRLPVVFNIVGSPLRFLIVGPASNEEPKIRFGFYIAGMKPVCRNVKIYNNSVFDIRIDWRVYNFCEDDQQIIDLNLFYGDPFPLLEPNGKEIVSAHTDVPKNDSSEESAANSEGQRERILNITCSPHIGISSDDPFHVMPKQMIIKGNSDASLVVMYNTPAYETSTQPYSYLSYACGFFSLDHNMQKIDSEKGIIRPEGWDKLPLKIHLTADVLVARLTVADSSDDRFLNATLGEIFSLDQEPEVNQKIYTLELINELEAAVSFSLIVSSPFCFLDADIYTVLSETNKMLSKLFTLAPQGALFLKVGFLMSEKLLQYWHQTESQSISESQESESDFQDMRVSVETINGQKWLYFRHFLKIEFGNLSVQKVPINARIALPEVVVSTDFIAFKTCFIGQQKSKEVTITNVSLSRSYLIISSEIRCACCDSNVFLVQPTRIELERFTCNTNKYKAIVTVTFKPRKAGFHHCVLTLNGVMGEKPKTIDLNGMGSHDERHLVLTENR